MRRLLGRSSAYANLLILSLFLITVITACTTVPITGRHQLLLISEQEELMMGARVYREIIRKEKLSRDPKYVNAVRRVGMKIASVSGRPDYRWEFLVIDNDKEANAFCLPGGKVFIYTGMFPYTKDDNGLATVISHEIGHAIARHGAERMTMDLLARVGAVGLSVALRNASPVAIRSFEQAYGLGATIGLILPFSRQQELEADHIGLILMAKAGYDPRGALLLWQRLMQSDKSHPPVFLSTHPSDEERIKRIKLLLPIALRYYYSSQYGGQYRNGYR
ncbi:MAG: M48 family peptidase [Deltaproteobacteria bacterium]|nr:MAG: M48 family peptidase [Deltaproteobacteria bacterium]